MKHIPFASFFVFLVASLMGLAGGRLAPQDEETTYRATANLIEYGRWTITAQTVTVEPQPYPGYFTTRIGGFSPLVGCLLARVFHTLRLNE